VLFLLAALPAQSHQLILIKNRVGGFSEFTHGNAKGNRDLTQQPQQVAQCGWPGNAVDPLLDPDGRCVKQAGADLSVFGQGIQIGANNLGASTWNSYNNWTTDPKKAYLNTAYGFYDSVESLGQYAGNASVDSTQLNQDLGNLGNTLSDPKKFNLALGQAFYSAEFGLATAAGGQMASRGVSTLMDTFATESTTLTRAAYVEEVEGLKDFANSARAAGQDAEATARMVSEDRNALKIKYRELSPPDFVQKAEARNIQKYGNPLGPTVDQLRAQGKSWEQIIDAAARAGGKDLGL